MRRHFKKVVQLGLVFNPVLGAKPSPNRWSLWPTSVRRTALALAYSTWATEFKLRTTKASSSGKAWAGYDAGKLLRHMDKAKQWWCIFLDHPEVPPIITRRSAQAFSGRWLNGSAWGGHGPWSTRRLTALEEKFCRPGSDMEVAVRGSSLASSALQPWMKYQIAPMWSLSF